MIEKGRMIKLEITDISDRGQGIGRVDGLVVFVSGTPVRGDTVIAEITKTSKNIAFAEMVSVEEPSPARIEPECPGADRCGGCAFSCTGYAAQLEIKTEQVRSCLKRIGGIREAKIGQIVAMEKPYAYRNKAVMHIGLHDGQIKVGFIKAGSHTVVDCSSCMVQTGAAMAAAGALRGYLSAQDPGSISGKGGEMIFDTMTVRTAFGTGEVMIILGAAAAGARPDAVSGAGIADLGGLAAALDQSIYEAGYSLESIIIDKSGLRSAGGGDGRYRKNVRPRLQDIEVAAGAAVMKERLGDLELEISPQSFAQVNPEMTVKLYDTVRKYAALTGKENILDLYCGTGTIGLWCAGEAGSVLGIESVKQAVLDANRNSVLNGVVNTRYICGMAEKVLPEIMAAGNGEGAENKKYDEAVISTACNADVVIVDPPRAGCRTELLEAAVLAGPERIIYVSCDPATLARDIKILCLNGYEFSEATPVDMFPWTRHVETCALLVKECTNDDEMVSINVDLEGISLDQGKFEPDEKPTYGNVKKWVEEKYGFKVSTLYISQIKGKVGIDKRKNYNVGSGEGRVPMCTPKKEDAIMDAFRHFDLI